MFGRDPYVDKMASYEVSSNSLGHRGIAPLASGRIPRYHNLGQLWGKDQKNSTVDGFLHKPSSLDNMLKF
jgi:hypothetical protein